MGYSEELSEQRRKEECRRLANEGFLRSTYESSSERESRQRREEKEWEERKAREYLEDKRMAAKRVGDIEGMEYCHACKSYKPEETVFGRDYPMCTSCMAADEDDYEDD